MSDASPLRIVYLVQQFPPEVGAGPARVAEMTRRWRDAGAQVTIVTGMPNRPEGRIHAPYRGRMFMEERWEGMRVLRSWLYASPRHGFARTILNNASFMSTALGHVLLRAGPADVMIASSPPFFPHISGAVYSALRGVPLVLEIRDLWPDYLVGMGVLKARLGISGLFALERGLLKRAAWTVAVTESFRRRIAEKGVPIERISVIPNGVDGDLYHPSAEPPPLPALERAEGETIVGYLGNFGAGQGLAQVVEAAARLRDHPGIRFVMAGDGPDRAAILALAAASGARITVHPPIAKEQTRAFYNACDLCLVPLADFPILQETVPSKIFEVMACERPVLAALAGEGARIVDESGGGWVVPPGEPDAMAAAIRRFVDLPPAERAATGARGRAYVQAHYSRHALADRYLEILTAVARPGAASAP